MGHVGTDFRMREKENSQGCAFIQEVLESKLGILDCGDSDLANLDEPDTLDTCLPTWDLCAGSAWGRSAKEKLPIDVCEAETGCLVLS